MMNNGGGETVDLPRVCFRYNLRMAALFLAAGVLKYIGRLTKVSRFDQAKLVPSGTGGRSR
jgi:hypothetical protein